ncbi:MAG: ferredoxin [Desulfuromonas sp.]|nr:MAG: ferredoxin [Desulfuromonas sp.]
MIAATLSIGGIGLCAAIALGIAARKFAVEVDPREAAILDVLSAANCGACGYPGCSAYAHAVALGQASPALCTPGGNDTVAKIAGIMGVSAEMGEPEVALLLCQGDNERAQEKYRYLGLRDCNAAQRLADGPKACPGGCLGLGTCSRACPFDAIAMNDKGLAVIDPERCTGCRKCVSVCPRQVIQMVPKAATVHVLCNSHDKGGVVRKYCQVGCLGCMICKKTAPEAYRIDKFLACVDYAKAAGAENAIGKCPTHCIVESPQRTQTERLKS